MRLDKNDGLDLDKKENMCRNVRRSLDSEFKNHDSGGQIVRENTSFLTEKDSVLLEAFSVLETFLEKMMGCVGSFKTQLKDPITHNDFVKDVDWNNFEKLCFSLRDLGPLIQQLLDEQNFRKSSTLYTDCMSKLLTTILSYRKMAYGCGVSTRQHQKIRARELNQRNIKEGWKEKDPLEVIRKISGFLSCPDCGFNQFDQQYYDKEGIPIKINSKYYKIPKKYVGRGMSPLEIASENWKGKLEELKIN